MVSEPERARVARRRARMRWGAVGVGVAAVVVVVVFVGGSSVPQARPVADGPAVSEVPGEAAESPGQESAPPEDLVAGRALRVRVLDCGHQAAGGAHVTLREAGRAARTLAEGTADARGVFEARVPEAAREVTAVAAREAPGGEHHGMTTEAPGAPGTKALEVVICPGATVQGVVRDARGRPLADAVVRFGGGEDFAETEADGEFVLTDVFLEADHVQVAHASGAAERVLAPRLVAGETRTLDLVVTSGHRVAGRVVAVDGSAVPNVPIMARNASGAVVARAVADRDGLFWLAIPDTAGEVGDTLQVRADGGSRGMAQAAVGARSPREDLVLTLAAAGVVVVLWEGPTPVTISVRGSPFGTWFPEGAASQYVASGEEQVRPAPGRYSASVSYRVDGDDWNLECGDGLLRPGERLVLRCGQTRSAFMVMRVLGPDGLPRPQQHVAFEWIENQGTVGLSGETDASGVLRQEFKVASSVSVGVKVGGRDPGIDKLERARVPVVPGETTDLGDLRMRTDEEVRAILGTEDNVAFAGLGAALHEVATGVAFQRIVRNGPLDLAGVRPGDVVMRVNGESASQLNLREGVLQFRGPVGTGVTLSLFRPGEGEFEVEVERAMVDPKNSGWVN